MELIQLAHSEDPLAKLKRSQLRGNVTDLSMFNVCYEKALAMLEKRELEIHYGKAGQVRDGKSIGKFIKNIFNGGHGNKDIDLEFSIEKSSSKDYDYYDDYDYGYGRRRTGPGCWVGQRWEDDRRWDDNRRRWRDYRQ